MPFASLVGNPQDVTSPGSHDIVWTEAGNASQTTDPFDMHSDGTNPERLTAPRAGYYYAYGTVEWEANLAGIRSLSMQHRGANGVQIASRGLSKIGPIGLFSDTHGGGWALQMAQGESVEVGGLHSLPAGTNLNLTPRQFSLFYIGPVV